MRPSEAAEPTDDVDGILSFLAITEKLKMELRHSWLSNGRRESVAEHSWHMAMLAILLRRHLREPVDLGRTLLMVAVHDLVEAIAGDMPVFGAGPSADEREQAERAAMRELRTLMPNEVGREIEAAWLEFEGGQTPEARLVRALDRIEVQAQHNLAPITTWEPEERFVMYERLPGACAHEPVLGELARRVIGAAERKLRAAGLDPRR